MEVLINLRASISHSHVGTVTMTIRVVSTTLLPVAAAGRLSQRGEVLVPPVVSVPAVLVVEVVDQAAEDNSQLWRIFYGC